MDSHTLLAALAGNHNLARILALAILETARRRARAATDIYGLVNISTNDSGPIDVWLDCAGVDTWQTAHAAVEEDQVVFRNVGTGDVPTKVVGSIQGRDRLEYVVDRDGKLWLVIAAVEPADAGSK